MTIAVFGASGGIGKFVVQHALDQGFEVKAYVRNPSKLNVSNEKLTIFKGELNDYDSIKNVINGCDAVVSVIGIPMKFYYKTMDSYEAHKNIIKAMQELNVTRLIDWATPSVPFEEDTKSFVTVAPGIIAGIVFPKSKQEIIEVSNLIVLSNLEWTIVRFIAPKDTAFTGKIKAGFGDVKMNMNISRSDIAYFMVQEISNREYIHSMPIIGS